MGESRKIKSHKNSLTGWAGGTRAEGVSRHTNVYVYRCNEVCSMNCGVIRGWVVVVKCVHRHLVN